AKEIRQARFSDWTKLRGGRNPAFLAIASVTFADGSKELYQMPLALVSGEQALHIVKELPGAVLSRITGARKGAIVDGVLDDDLCDRLLGVVSRQQEVATTLGSVRAVAIAGVEVPAERRWTRGNGDQSNSLAFEDDRYVLKVFRRIEPGVNP